MSPHDPDRPGDLFATTRWSVVLTAGRSGGAPAERAREELCAAYWFPLYAYVRRRGHSREDAEDLTQEFLSRFLASGSIGGLNAGRGRFRAFLLASMKHFLANEWDKSKRLKRGGNAPHFALDWQTADSRFQLTDTAAGPEAAYDREWAIALLGQVIDSLRAEFVAEGRAAQFDALKGFLTTAPGVESYGPVATALGMECGAVRVAVHRLRRRYRELLRREIAQTLADPTQVEEEMRSLFRAFTA